jgi:hypothetical protein
MHRREKGFVPYLPENCVVVADNAAYYSERLLTPSPTKKGMEEWLLNTFSIDLLMTEMHELTDFINQGISDIEVFRTSQLCGVGRTNLHIDLILHYGPGVDSASNRDEYQESSWG